MRKKKENITEPRYKKGSLLSSRSKNQHSIVSRHESCLSDFRNIKEKINVIDKQIKEAKREREKTGKDRAQKILNNEFSITESDKMHELDFKIQALEKTKEVINSGREESNYILESATLICNYMQLEDAENSLLQDMKGESDDVIDKLNEIRSKKNIITDEYLRKFDNKYINLKNLYNNIDIVCEQCNEHYDIEGGYLVCPICGICKATIDNNGEMSYKEMQDYDYRPQFTYEKETHLLDWIRRFQAKENRVIPQNVIDLVILEAKKDRVIDLANLSEDKVKKYLKKLKLNDFYDNVISIINRINGRSPFTLTAEIEEKIKTMFHQIQEPFERHKPKNRKNFLSYSYTLHKMFQILGLHEFSKYFPLLKSPEKLRQQDDIFKKIVAEMAEKDKSINWVFYPSI